MKNLLIFVPLLFDLCFNTEPVFAGRTDKNNTTTSSTVSISIEKNEKAVTLRIIGSLKDKIDIKLTDDYGTTLYSENVENTMLYTKKLVLANLKNGTYYISVQRKMTRTTESMELTDANVTLNESGRIDILLPYVSLKDDKVDINCMAKGNTNIIIRFFDTEGKLILEDVNKNVFNVNKRFDLSKLSYGVYIVNIIYDDQDEYSTLYYNLKNKKEV